MRTWTEGAGGAVITNSISVRRNSIHMLVLITKLPHGTVVAEKGKKEIKRKTNTKKE